MPSATLNNSDPGSAIGQARKSHPPASFKIKGQGGIKGKDNTSLKQRLRSAVPTSQLPTMFCSSESAREPGSAVAPWHGTTLAAAHRGTRKTLPPFPHRSFSPTARENQLGSRYRPTLTS